jgi:hypothetical protein
MEIRVMSYTWFKLHHDLPDDIKLRRFTPQEKWAWVTLLCLASRSEQRGFIKADDEDIAEYCEFNTTQDWLYYRDKLIAKGMLEISATGTLHVLHWEARQYQKPSDTPQSVKERVRKHRLKKKLASQQGQGCNGNAPVTPAKHQGNATDTDLDPDQTRSREEPEKKEDPTPPPESSPSADEVNAHEVPRPKKVGYVHPAVLMEMNFANGGESPLPWVVKRIGPYQYEYDPEMVLATIEYLKTTPSYEKNPPTPKNAKSWISVCNNPNHEKYATRMELAYAVWESAQKLKQRNAEAAQKQAAQNAQGDAVLQHLYRRWGGTPA